MISSQLLSSRAPTMRSSMNSKFIGEAAYPMKKRPASELRDPKGMDWRTISTGLACCQLFPGKQNHISHYMNMYVLKKFHTWIEYKYFSMTDYFIVKQILSIKY